MQQALDRAGLSAYLTEIFPQVSQDYVVEDLSPSFVTMRLIVSNNHLRPGGTISGPAMFTLADVSVYALVLSMVGKYALAVTTNCSMDFMRKPVSGRDLIAKAELLKLGRVLAVGDVRIYSEGDDRPVARAAMTYSLPPQGSPSASFSNVS